jgi:hypothetical protein
MMLSRGRLFGCVTGLGYWAGLLGCCDSAEGTDDTLETDYSAVLLGWAARLLRQR